MIHPDQFWILFRGCRRTKILPPPVFPFNTNSSSYESLHGIHDLEGETAKCFDAINFEVPENGTYPSEFSDAGVFQPANALEKRKNSLYGMDSEKRSSKISEIANQVQSGEPLLPGDTMPVSSSLDLCHIGQGRAPSVLEAENSLPRDRPTNYPVSQCCSSRICF